MSDGSPPPLDAQAMQRIREAVEYQLAHPEEYHTEPATTVLALLARVDDLERERAGADGDWAEIGATQAARAEAAEAEVARLSAESEHWQDIAQTNADACVAVKARLLAAQQALRDLLGVQPAIPVTADRWRAAVENANLALAAVGRVPAQEDKP